MSVIRIQTPITEEIAASLRVPDMVLLSGTIYTARDRAHKRIIEMAEQGEPLPLDPKGQVLYYAGPSPTPPGKPVGAVGPT
nr:fumarate hydratase C-terminal domain-containing protein [Spirochaetota bacterium]